VKKQHYKQEIWQLWHLKNRLQKSQTPTQGFMDLAFALRAMLVLWMTQPIIAETVVKNWIGNNQ
jgi:hypothetical protein